MEFIGNNVLIGAITGAAIILFIMLTGIIACIRIDLPSKKFIFWMITIGVTIGAVVGGSLIAYTGWPWWTVIPAMVIALFVLFFLGK